MSALALLQTLAPYAPTAFAAFASVIGGALALGFSADPVRAALGHHLFGRA